MLEEKEGLRVLTVYICLDLNLVYFYTVYYASLLVVGTGFLCPYGTKHGLFTPPITSIAGDS